MGAVSIATETLKSIGVRTYEEERKVCIRQIICILKRDKGIPRLAIDRGEGWRTVRGQKLVQEFIMFELNR